MILTHLYDSISCNIHRIRLRCWSGVSEILGLESASHRPDDHRVDALMSLDLPKPQLERNKGLKLGQLLRDQRLNEHSCTIFSDIKMKKP
jgi:hypothetical protein